MSRSDSAGVLAAPCSGQTIAGVCATCGHNPDIHDESLICAACHELCGYCGQFNDQHSDAEWASCQADLRANVPVVGPGIDWEMVAHQAGAALDASEQALAGKVARLRAARLRYVCLSTQLSTREGRMHCYGVAAGLDMAIAVVEDILTADDDITVTEE